MGHGIESDFLIKIPAIIRITRVMIDISTLYCEIIISCGKLLVKVAKVAPAPIATNIAGRAQHINVEDDTTRLTIPNFFDFISWDIFYSFFIVTFVAV